MPLTDVPGKARALYEARRTRRAIEPFTDADPDLGMADGYAIAQQLTRLLLTDGDTVIGYKVGLTSKPMQQMIGVSSPDHGPVLRSTVYADGDAIPLSRFIQPRIEAEIAFVLSADLRGPGVTALQARQAIARMVAAVEIADSRFAGWRIRLAPVRGFLAAADALDLGEPLLVSEYIQPRAEPEIAFLMGTSLAGPTVSSADVMAATAAVAVGVEVLDSRYRDHTFTAADVVADNTSAARYVIGPAVPAAGLDLRLLGVLLEHNGEVIATAAGAAALGHPASAVAWLVRSLAAENDGLRPGDLVLSGGLTAAVALQAGDVVAVAADRLGGVEIGCR